MPGGWRRCRGERINMGGAQPLHGRHEAPKHAPSLFGDPCTCGPILGEAVLLQVLKGEPIQLANDIGSVFHGSIPVGAAAQCGGVAYGRRRSSRER
jgi:hypothetical protein